MPPPLGAHLSIAGGMYKAIERGTELECDAIQVFVKNASQWVGKPLSEEDIDRFRQAHGESRIGPLVAHATYLINLAATDPDNLRKSRSTFGDELDRCERLGIGSLVLHPGAHLGTGVDAGIARVAESLQTVLADRPGEATRVLLEITAGQGTLLGHTLEQLVSIRQQAGFPERVGVCVDTCHAFAAGYPLHEQSAYQEFFAKIHDFFGADEPACIHLNDSRHVLGAKRDRHANLGEGEIPVELFARLIADPALTNVPTILETPIGDDEQGHRRDLEYLRSL